MCNTANLVIDNPVWYERRKNQDNFAHNFDLINSIVVKATTMPNFGIVKATGNRLGWTAAMHTKTHTHTNLTLTDVKHCLLQLPICIWELEKI